MSGLAAWIAAEARYAARTMLGAISATDRLTERPGFAQRVIPAPGSVLASPVPAHYDPDPDYFFHWFRDSAIVIDALRVALNLGYADRAALVRLREFVQFSLALHSLNGKAFLEHSDLRARVRPDFLQYLRPESEIAAVSGETVSADVRVNADGTLDFTRWSRPQNDGAALRAISLLRWWREFPELHEDSSLDSAASGVIGPDLAFTLSRVRMPSTDIWEEQSGYHYYTQLVQAEALIRGAAWLAANGHSSREQACRAAAAELLTRLDSLWSGSDGFYRSGAPVECGATRSEPDIAVVLAVLHVARSDVRHSVLDPRAQATLTALEELFETQYAINRARPAGRGPAMGRYPNDRYYSGGAWYLATLAAAEFYFRLAAALAGGAPLARAPENLRFRERLGPGLAAGGGEEALRVLERGDEIMRTVRAFTPAGGELSEQFDQTTGEQTSAKHLSWSYAAFITAAAGRLQACRSMKAAGFLTSPAGAG